MTVFDDVQARIEKGRLAPNGDLAAQLARDQEAFEGVEAFLGHQVQAMRDAGFAARLTKRIGASNHTLEWHPGNPGELPARTTATFEVEAAPAPGARHQAHISFVNDEGAPTTVFFSALHMTPQILQTWFAAFVDLCLTARLSRGAA